MPTDLLYSVVVILALLQVVGTTSPFTVSDNNHYLGVDTFSPDTSQTFANASATSLTPLNYYVNYLQSFPLAQNLTVALTTQSMDILHSGGRIQFYGKFTDKNSTQISFSMESNFTFSIK